MTLAIAKTKFTADADVSKVRTALSSIPEPQHSTEMPADLTPDNAVIALQREIVALDLIHMPPTVQYTGTKNLVTCVYARIYNDEQELGIHVDSVIAPLDISSMLEHFRRKDNLKVMLIGGVPGGDSELILNYLLTSLINASEVMTVTCQKLLVRNQPKEITDRVFMRDFITRKAALLYRRLFEKELDIGKISTYPLSYFQDSTTIDETFNTWGQKDRDVMDKGVVCIAESFLILNEYVKVENIKKLDNILIRIRSYIKNEEDFHRYFKVLFSPHVYSGLMPQYKNIAYDTEVINFVINIKTCDVYSIPVFFDTPYEAYRTVFLHDQQEKSDPRAKRYFLAYDQCRATMPGLSSEAIKEIGIFYKHIDYHRDLSIFITQRGYEFFRALSTIRRRDPEVALCTAPILLRYSDKNRLGACYTDSKEAENSAVLQCLNEYMPNNVKFTSKIREYPSHIVDALLACDDWSVAIQYQQYLKDKNIEAHIIYHNTLGLTLCVPGINVSQGRGIGKADERPALKQPWV